MAGDADLNKQREAFGQKMKPLSDTITVLAFTIELKDPYTRRHCENVSRLAAQIARQMRLSEAEIEDIRLAGIVHDIGKIHVPEYELSKPGPLMAEEFEKMKSHAVWGARILEPLKEKGIEWIVRHHHERYGGSGYPDGLKGDDIPIGARIIAVAEAFDNMVSDLPYRQSNTVAEALAELRRCSGTQFDPKVVTAFLDWVQIHGDPREQQ
jgi:putative nucleotidyltransferase with HDIG domain